MTAVSAPAAGIGRSGGVPVWLLMFGMSTQSGSFAVMIDNAARLLTGNLQIQHPTYHEDPAIAHRLTDATALAATVAEMTGLDAVLPRLQSFALISAGEKSFGGQVIGVDPALEAAGSSLPTMVTEGRYLRAPGEAFVGEVLASNLMQIHRMYLGAPAWRRW